MQVPATWHLHLAGAGGRYRYWLLVTEVLQVLAPVPGLPATAKLLGGLRPLQCKQEATGGKLAIGMALLNLVELRKGCCKAWQKEAGSREDEQRSAGRKTRHSAQKPN